MSANTQKLDRLFAANPNCHWCGVLTRDDMATFDHLVEGSNIMRPTPIPRPGVLSCYKCNHVRGHEYMKARRAHRLAQQQARERRAGLCA